MPKGMDPILPFLSISGYWVIILGTLEIQVVHHFGYFGGPGTRSSKVPKTAAFAELGRHGHQPDGALWEAMAQPAQYGIMKEMYKYMHIYIHTHPLNSTNH